MKRAITFTQCCLMLLSLTVYCQVEYGIPPPDLIPEKLKDLRKAIEVTHFPQVNDPVKIENTYYWKHATSVLCKESEIRIVEFGAYIFYNDQWNLRKTYPLNELDKYFNTRKQTMLHGQPYTWPDNWRTGDKLFGGWAMWYFIGETESGERICGYDTILTTSNLLNE